MTEDYRGVQLSGGIGKVVVNDNAVPNEWLAMTEAPPQPKVCKMFMVKISIEAITQVAQGGGMIDFSDLPADSECVNMHVDHDSALVCFTFRSELGIPKYEGGPIYVIQSSVNRTSLRIGPVR